MLWFAEKLVSLLYQRHLNCWTSCLHLVVICWKISIFVISKTSLSQAQHIVLVLWFAEKLVSLLYQRHQCLSRSSLSWVVICWKISIFVISKTSISPVWNIYFLLWFAEKLVSLLYQRHPIGIFFGAKMRCDLLKN